MKTALLSLALVASAAGLAHADPEDAAGLFSGCSESESDMTTGCGTDASTGEPTLSCDVSGTRKHGSSLPTFGVFAFVGLAIARKRRRSRA